MIEADTQLPEIWQIVKSVSKIQNLSGLWQCLSVKIAPPVNVWDDIVWQIEVFEMWQF